MKFVIPILCGWLFTGAAWADISGSYAVKGLLLKPVSRECEFELYVRIAANQFALSAFTCGEVDFPGLQVSYRAGTLRDLSGRVIGSVTEDTLTFQSGGKTIHLLLRDDHSGGFNYFGSGFTLHGELTKVSAPSVTASR